MIQLKYLAHSSFLVECGKTKILFDPWLKGGAYMNQWHLWPLPPDEIEALQADIILISHGHEDHLHTETLEFLKKHAHVFFPFQWREGVKSFLRYLGYSQITEALTLRTYTIKDIKITYLGYSLESVIIIEYGNEILVNINDALNSNHENAVNLLLKEIKARWSKIDYLISGWSGASYFPNQIRYPGKEDVEIGKIREQYFANNFFRFTNYLQPAFAVAIPPGFVLLKKNNQWINHVKFPRTKLEDYYRQYFTNRGVTKFVAPFPGDSIVNGELKKVSHLHNLDEEGQYSLAYKHYEKEIERANAIVYEKKEEVERLIKQLTYWINYNKKLYHDVILKDSLFTVRLEDMETDTYLNVVYKDSAFIVMEANSPLEDRRLLITTTVKNLLYSLKRVWGGDVLTIGYGLIVEVYNQLTLEKNLDIVCIRLITRYPIAKKEMPKSPLRVFRFYANNPKITTFWLKQKVKLKPYVNKYPFNERDHWLTYNKCDLCAVCKMPEINLGAYAPNN